MKESIHTQTRKIHMRVILKLINNFDDFLFHQKQPIYLNRRNAL
jgi:hypothetical protein